MSNKTQQKAHAFNLMLERREAKEKRERAKLAVINAEIAAKRAQK